jgi:2-methylcitrate dehydratase PrpD
MILQKQKVLFCMSFIVAASLIFTSCQTVKEYQKNKLNDSDMILSSRKIEKTELNFQSYREGASGANGGKTGGGCGCN